MNPLSVKRLVTIAIAFFNRYFSVELYWEIIPQQMMVPDSLIVTANTNGFFAAASAKCELKLWLMVAFSQSIQWNLLPILQRGDNLNAFGINGVQLECTHPELVGRCLRMQQQEPSVPLL
jgi:hypothetical protein